MSSLTLLRATIRCLNYRCKNSCPSSGPSYPTQRLAIEALESRWCPALTLTPAAVDAGYGLSVFAQDFPTIGGSFGPYGIAFPDSGGVLVADSSGNVRLFPTDADGQSAFSYPPGYNYGQGNATDLAKVGSAIYMTQENAGRVVQINDDGTLPPQQEIIRGLPSAGGMVANPVNGHLFVDDLNNGHLFEVDPAAHTFQKVLDSGYLDGLAITDDGSILYAARKADNHVVGYDTSNLANIVFDSGPIRETQNGPVLTPDGLVLGTGPFAGNLYVNTVDGIVVAIDLATGDQTALADGGSRGDFAVMDLNDGSLLLTQSDRVLRLSLQPGVANTLQVDAPVTAAPGSPFRLTVSARDALGHIATGYAGTVTFSTTDPDPGVVLPADYTFTPADGGVHTFTDTGLGETTLVTPGAQTLTATDTADDTITGSAVITVSTTHLLVSDYVTPGRVSQYDAAGRQLSDLGPPPSGELKLADALTFGPDGQLYVVSQGTHSVLRFDGQTGMFLDTFTSDRLVNPIGLTFGPDGNLYVSDSNNNIGAVLRYDGSTGMFIGAFVARGSGGLTNPHGLTFGPDGNLYVDSSSSGSDAVLRYDGQTGQFLDRFVTPRAELRFPQDLLFGPDGNLYVSGISSSSVCRYNGTTGMFIDVFTRGGPLDGATGLAFGPDGNLYVGSINNNKVLRYDGQTGQFLDVFADTGLNKPVFLTFGDIQLVPPGPRRTAPIPGRASLPAWTLPNQAPSPVGTLVGTSQAQFTNRSEPLTPEVVAAHELFGSFEERSRIALSRDRCEQARATDSWAQELSGSEGLLSTDAIADLGR